MTGSEIVAALIAAAVTLTVWLYEKNRNFRTASYIRYSESIESKDLFLQSLVALGIHSGVPTIDDKNDLEGHLTAKEKALHYFVTHGYMIKIWLNIEPRHKWYDRLLDFVICHARVPAIKAGIPTYYFAHAIKRHGLFPALERYLGATDALTAMKIAVGEPFACPEEFQASALCETFAKGAAVGGIFWFGTLLASSLIDDMLSKTEGFSEATLRGNFQFIMASLAAAVVLPLVSAVLVRELSYCEQKARFIELRRLSVGNPAIQPPSDVQL